MVLEKAANIITETNRPVDNKQKRTRPHARQISAYLWEL
jgi:hypothetical protein